MSDIIELSLFHLETESFMAIFGSDQGLGKVARIGQVMTYHLDENDSRVQHLKNSFAGLEATLEKNGLGDNLKRA